MAQERIKVGNKYDGGKIRAGLVLGDFSRALIEVCRVGSFGADKYSPGDWVHVKNGIDRYTDAMLRHYLAEQVEDLDSESELLHAAHLAWNALARLDLILRQGEGKISTESETVERSTSPKRSVYVPCKSLPAQDVVSD